MLNAADARKKAESNLKNGLTEELEMVEKLISKAISEGKCSIFIKGVLGSETVKQLKSLGYGVEVGGRYNESDTDIKW